ncbi:MAG: FecR domain-containing protein [Bacteroidota bacterium]
MISQRTQKLIVQYLTHQASLSELEELEVWLEKPANDKLFLSYVKTNYVIDYNMKEFNTNRSKKQLLEYIGKEKRKSRLHKRQTIFKYAAAAVVIGILATGYFFKANFFENTIETGTPIIVNNKIETGTDKATLTLEDGSVVTLGKGVVYQAQNVTSNREEIVYNTSNATSRELVYNYLTIPRRGQFQMTLSDGTKVWLNSESKIKYPVSFKDGETRQVELLYGEAYFDVSPSTKHNGSSFKVFNQYQEVEVLGTEFNIKAYKDEPNIHTTLVEGKVNVNIENRKQNLIPNQQLILDIKTNTSIIKTVDIYNEISWKEGVFSFEDKSLKEIMAVLSRWYDMDVVFKNKRVEDEEFIGVLGKEQDIEDILSIIKNFGVIKDYEINDKTVVLE